MTGHFILGTAGHVDHGKSALVKALTGTDPDRLPEEKARGITIDLGFAHLELALPIAPGGGTPPPFSVGIVDVPGHEDFIKNMVAGVGAIDVALLAVAADDGWMPQTEEHVQILTYLGVTRAVVALTKIDLLDGPASEAAGDVRRHLQSSPFAGAPIIPTSAVTGTGLAELRDALATLVLTAPAPRDLGKPRLAVDRVFTLRGVGTIVTGTLTGGTVRRGAPLVIQPAGLNVRARSLHSYHQEVPEAGPGSRTAINLPDVAPDRPRAAGVARGDVLAGPGLGGPADTADAVIEKSGRLAGIDTAAARPLRDGALVRVHFGTANAAARVRLLNGQSVLPGERRLGQLRFERPVYLFAGDRFIIRDGAGQATLAGGVVLGPDASRRGWGRPGQQKYLAERMTAIEDVRASVAACLARDGVARPGALLVKSRFSAAEVSDAVDRLAAAGQAVRLGDCVADAAWWRTFKQRAVAAVDADHREHPERPGLPLHDLRAMLARDLAVPEVFPALLAELGRCGFQTAANTLRRTSHRVTLPPALQAAATRVRDALSAKPFDPPSRPALLPDATSRRALQFLVDAGEAVEISPDVAMSAVAFEAARDQVLAHLAAHGQATVSALRQILGSSRRVMVPLLEHLDRQGHTRRQGDARVLGPAALRRPG